MKHLKSGRKFGRKKGQREALLKILIGELLTRGKITTTEAKAKELKSIVEKLIGKAKLVLVKEKNARISALRFITARVPRNISTKNIEEIAKDFSTRKSGFARIVKTGQRKSDGARMALIELIKDKA